MSKFAAAVSWRLFIAQTFIYANWLAVCLREEKNGRLSSLASLTPYRKPITFPGTICIYIYGTYRGGYVTSPVMTQVCGTFYVCKILQEMVMLCCNFLHWFMLQFPAQILNLIIAKVRLLKIQPLNPDNKKRGRKELTKSEEELSLSLPILIINIVFFVSSFDLCCCKSAFIILPHFLRHYNSRLTFLVGLLFCYNMI